MHKFSIRFVVAFLFMTGKLVGDQPIDTGFINGDLLTERPNSLPCFSWVLNAQPTEPFNTKTKYAHGFKMTLYRPSDHLVSFSN
jgi:hypothetical protein